jgi:hypothetical protein
MKKLLLAAAAVAALALPAQAAADVTVLDPASPGSPITAAQALLGNPSDLATASLTEYAFGGGPPAPSPLGVGSSNAATDPPHQLVGFPTAGETYAVLSSGDINTVASVFDNPDNEETSFDFVDQFAPPVPPGPDRGVDTEDWTVLRVDVQVPLSANCLSLDYRFLSEEYPNFVGSQYNDAFFAEIDSTSWSVADGGQLTRPNDFAVSAAGNPISVNGVGDTAMLSSEASGTYFNAATGLITTKTPITPGPHAIYLSVFDASDSILDSAVFLDDLRFIAEDPSTCKPPTGQQIAPPPPPTPPAPGAPPAPPAPPSNKFQPGSSASFGKSNTSATLTVVVPGPGVLTAGSTSVGAASASAAIARRAEAAAKAKTPAKGKKKKKGKKKAKPKVKKPLLNTSTVRATQAGPVQITVSLSGTGKALLAKKGKLTIPVTLTFTPDGGTAASQVQTVTFKKKKAKKCAAKPKGKARAKGKAAAKGCKKPAKGKSKKK